MPREACDICEFDSDDYNHSDLIGTLRAIAPMWRTTVDGIDPSVLSSRPEPGVWSAIEYAAHSRDITELMGLGIDALLSPDGLTVDDPPGPDLPDPQVRGSIDETIDSIEAPAQAIVRKAAKFTPEQWARAGRLGSDEIDVEWAVAHAVHDAVHHLRDVGRGLHALGAGAPSQRGTLVQVNSSNGGVPKSPLLSAEIGRRGVIGDRQGDRRHHGRPLQALSVWSQDVIDALRGEGHPIEAGLAGENLTIGAIDWATIRPGVRLLIGEVLCEISRAGHTLTKNNQWFADNSSKRIDHDLHPGWSRMYAWVLEGGSVRPGDEVVVEP